MQINVLLKMEKKVQLFRFNLNWIENKKETFVCMNLKNLHFIKQFVQRNKFHVKV